ncbi:hypothetical protein GOB57_24610 [Sinorhizobium meliloti]|nr:hypothetical protein [Sinorhizobium meliloti]
MTAYSTRPVYNDLSDGDEVVLRRGFSEEHYKVVTLRGADGGFTSAAAGDGTVFEFKSSGGHDGRFEATSGERWSLYFSYPLPQMSDEDRIAYARALRGDTAPFPRQSYSEWDNTVAFFVEEVADGMVAARMISHEIGYVSKNEESVNRLSYKSLEDAEVRACATRAGTMWATTAAVELDPLGLPAVAVGNVIVATNLSVKYVDGRPLTTLGNPTLLPGIITLEKASELFPIREGKQNRQSPFVALNRQVLLEPIAHWEYRKEVARHALDPDEALVVVFPDPDNPGGSSEHIGFLTSKGAFFYSDTDYAHDQISTHGDLMPGVRHITETRPWAYRCHEGEWDAGVDFKEEPVSDETIARFGLDATSLGTLIRGHLDEEDRRFEAMDDVQIGEFMLSLSRSHANKMKKSIALPQLT